MSRYIISNYLKKYRLLILLYFIELIVYFIKEDYVKVIIMLSLTVLITLSYQHLVYYIRNNCRYFNEYNESDLKIRMDRLIIIAILTIIVNLIVVLKVSIIT